MPDTVSKTDNFLKAIEKYAEQQRSKLQHEAEDFKETELNKAEEEGLEEAYILIQRQMTSINTHIARELSKAEGESRKEIFIKRNEIEEMVFDKAKTKLVEFTDSEKYLSQLLKSVELVSGMLKADDVVIYVKKNDMKYADRIKKAFIGGKCSVEASKEIQIGGILGVSRSLGLLADETLDTKLEEQREWFFENSGLKVTD